MHVSDIDASDCGKYKKISDAFGGPTRRPRKWQFPSQVETGEGGRTRSILVCRFNVTYPMRTKIDTVKELDPVNNPFTAFFKIWPHTKRSNMSKGRGRGAEQVANCHFWFVISIWHDQCGQKLARWSYLTLGTSLILKRCFFSKFASLTPHREVKVQNLT